MSKIRAIKIRHFAPFRRKNGRFVPTPRHIEAARIYRWLVFTKKTSVDNQTLERVFAGSLTGAIQHVRSRWFVKYGRTLYVSSSGTYTMFADVNKIDGGLL